MSGLSNYSQLVEDFSAGYRDGHEPNRLPPGATPDAANAWFDAVSEDSPRRVTLARRAGSRLLNPTPISAGKRIDGLFDFHRSGADAALLAMCDGHLTKFDGTDTFADLGGGWTGGRPARAAQFRDNLLVVDGTAGQRTDGTDLFSIGTARPTGAPGLATTGASGVTGTYRGFAVWYDPTMDHESSPSDVSAAVVFANQTRRWTEPTGAPPAEYTKWRMYVQRTDTNELNFYLAGEFDKGSGTGDEATSDDDRSEIGPDVGENDPPPADLSALIIALGYGIGLRKDSDEYVISKQGDLQSWPPKQRLNIGHGSGIPLTAVKLYNTEIYLQQDHATYRLDGTAFPFAEKTVHPSYGGVSDESSLVADSLFFAWDRVKGPYSTDMTTFTPLNRGRIKKVIARITRSALEQLRAGHDEENAIVFWSVPVDGSSRTRLFLPYCYRLDCWLPPVTGLEWAAVTSWTDPTTNTTGLYVGDEWGRVYQFLTGRREGVPTTNPMSTLTGMPTAADANTLTDDGAAFYTTGAGLAGIPVLAVSPAGAAQWRRIASNTATVLTLDTTNDSPFNPVPDETWTYYVGAINFYWTTPPFDEGDAFTEKKALDFYANVSAARPTDKLRVSLKLNGRVGIETSLDFSFSSGGGAVWGVAMWGQDVWGAGGQLPAKRGVARQAYSHAFVLQSYEPDAGFVITAIALTTDRQPRRKSGDA